MNPLVTVNENLQLEGDFVITGPVSIKRILSTSDNIFSSNTDLNLRNLLEKGLKLQKTETNTQLNFKQVLVVENNLLAPKINGRDTSKFIKTNFKGLQEITATKSFDNSLQVEGSCEGGIINKVKVQQLNETMLKKTSPITQVVSGRIQFNKMFVNQ